jgi:Ca-activated chloride channel family protein
MTGFDFSMPLALVLLPLPLLIAMARRGRPAPQGALRIPTAIRDRMKAGEAGGAPQRHARLLAWIAWAALVVALAGPRTVAATPALPASGRDIMLALDLSGSMVTRDFAIHGKPVSRIDALKSVGADLIRRRAGDRIGLVIFAEHAYAAAPLSFDVEAVSQTLEEMTIGLVGRSTAIGDGLGLALKRLTESKAPSRIIILLSDGSNNAGSTDPMGVARLARQEGVRLYTIGLGVNDTTMPNDDPDPVDFGALKELAEVGNGEAFRVRTTEDLAEATRAIEQLVVGPSPAPPAVVRRDLWAYPATLTLLASIGIFLSRRRVA